jgi:hypothetical protein
MFYYLVVLAIYEIEHEHIYNLSWNLFHTHNPGVKTTKISICDETGLQVI